MGYFEYLVFGQGRMFALGMFLVFGFLYGLLASADEPWIDKLKALGLSMCVWGLFMYPVTSYFEWTTYSKNFTTCQKPIAKAAGYLYNGDKCYKPVGDNAYILVSERINTKETILGNK